MLYVLEVWGGPIIVPRRNLLQTTTKGASISRTPHTTADNQIQRTDVVAELSRAEQERDRAVQGRAEQNTAEQSRV